MRVDVLGAVSVTDGVASISGRDLGGRRVRMALVALALADGPVPADRLARMIWEGELPATWSTALRGVIRSLRQAVTPVGGGAEALIVTTPQGYSLAKGVEVDVVSARSAISAAQNLMGQGRHRGALEAIDVTPGSFLPELLAGEDAEWLEPHRDAIENDRHRALELISEAAGALGDHARAVASARLAVAAHPLDERAHRRLMTMLDRAGDRAAAIEAYEVCRAVLADRLGVDPSAETAEVYVGILQDQVKPGGARLPVVATTFIGRVTECAELKTALGQPGLLTLVGRGGVGKSRLAVQAASTTGFVGGRHWVSLATVTADELVGSAVAIALGVAVGAPETLIGHLAPLGRSLLVLDGCEALLDGVASLISALVAGCPQLTVVVTSRIALGIDGERLVPVDPLPAVDAENSLSLLKSPQIQLLRDRVVAGGGMLSVDDASGPLLARLCEVCDGLPLALELAAAQLTVTPVGDLLDLLPDTLAQEDRLRAVARSSYDLLADDEAEVLRLFGILSGWVGLPLLRDVIAEGRVAPVRVVRILRELTARGLLIVDRSGPRWRYQQDDDLRRFSHVLLVEAAEELPAIGRLASAIVNLLPADARESSSALTAAIDDVLDSVRTVLSAAVEGRLDRERGLELAFRLHRYWAATNVAEGRWWLTRLLEGVGADSVEAGGWIGHATFALGYLSYWNGDDHHALVELQRAVDLLGERESPYAVRSLIFIAGLLDDLDRGQEAVDVVRRAIEAAASFEVDLQVSAIMGMGCVLAERADPAAADFVAEAIDLCRREGSELQLAVTLPTAATVSWQVGAVEAARNYLTEAMPMHADSRRISRVILLATSAGIAMSDGDLATAVEHGRRADVEATELGIERELPMIRALLAHALLRSGQVAAAAERAIAAISKARSMPFSYPLAIALEAAVAVACAEGLSDAQRMSAARILQCAQGIRTRGSRPPLPYLQSAVTALRSELAVEIAGAAVVDEDSAARLAEELLALV